MSKSSYMPYTFTLYYTDLHGRVQHLIVSDSTNEGCLELASKLWDVLAEDHPMINDRPIYKGN